MCLCASLKGIGQISAMDVQTQAQLAKLGPIFDALGEKAVAISVLGGGAQASIWRIQTDRRTYALRVLKPGSPGLDPAIDARLRRTLSQNGAAVVRPVLTSEEVTTPKISAQWVLDDFVDGRPLSGPLLRQPANDLGHSLGVIHGLDQDAWAEIPVSLPSALSGLGKLRLGAKQALYQELIHHTLAPENTRVAVCHGDLHADQVFRKRHGGIAILDFGLARRCDCRWDLAAVLLAYGRGSFDAVLAGYPGNAVDLDKVLPFAQTLAIAALMRGRAKAAAAQTFLDNHPVQLDT
jgi:aminoglycoside phosphotransferase (APT) family kinase protein